MTIVARDGIRIQRYPGTIPNALAIFGIEQDKITDAPELLGIIVRAIPLPYDLPAQTARAKYGIQQDFQIGEGCVICVQVQAAIGTQDTMHLHQPHAQPAEKCRHIIAIGCASNLNHLPDRGPIVDDAVGPFFVHIFVPAPAVFEARAGCQAVGRGVVVAVFVEGRVGGDEVHRLAVHAAQEVQVVAVIEAAILKVGLCHVNNPNNWLSQVRKNQPAKARNSDSATGCRSRRRNVFSSGPTAR